MPCVSSRSQARSDRAESKVRAPASVSPWSLMLQNGSWSTVISPRSAIDRKNTVDRVRGALHNANTAMGATYRSLAGAERADGEEELGPGQELAEAGLK